MHHFFLPINLYACDIDPWRLHALLLVPHKEQTIQRDGIKKTTNSLQSGLLRVLGSSGSQRHLETLTIEI